MIRLMTPEDVSTLLPLAEFMHKESSFSDMNFDLEKAAQTILIHSQHLDYFGAVYEVDGAICGAIGGSIKPTYFGSDSIAQDTFIFVSPFHRGHGIAKAMIDGFTQWAESKGVARCYVGSLAGTKTNPSEVEGYELAGNVIMRKF